MLTIPGITVFGAYRVADSYLFVGSIDADFGKYVTGWYSSGEKEWSLGHYFHNRLDARDDFATRLRKAV
jgi:hypothetical protein